MTGTGPLGVKHNHCVVEGVLKLVHVPGTQMVADFLTKNMAGPHVRQLIDAASGYSSLPLVPSKLKILQ